MSEKRTALSELPATRLEVVEELSPPGQTGFLRLIRRRYVAHYPDGSKSEPFVYDEIARAALDAAVIVAHVARGAERLVYLRSAVRPPLAMRAGKAGVYGLWELPAGLIEPEEANDADGALRCAARELHEEVGFDVPLERFRALGAVVWPVPAVIAERHFFFEVEVDPAELKSPTLDGSPLERLGEVCTLELAAALALCRNGTIEDSKTELGLRRLAERYP
jgi:ADP-ribose pyrophosphatase